MNAFGLNELILILSALLASLPAAISGTVFGLAVKVFWLFLLRGA